MPAQISLIQSSDTRGKGHAPEYAPASGVIFGILQQMKEGGNPLSFTFSEVNESTEQDSGTQYISTVEEKTKDLGPKEDVYDGAGNKIDVKANVSLSSKDMKKRIKDIEKKLKSAKKDNTLSEAEMYELTDELAELKENVKKEEKA